MDVDEETSDNVARYFFWRTNALTMGKSVGDQIRAALKGHFAATRGGGPWVVGTSADPDVAPTVFGNPVVSTVVADMIRGHRFTKARPGEMEVRRVDPIEPCHLLRCWDKHFAGLSLDEVDPRMLMAYSATLLSISLLLRYDKLTMLRYVSLLFLLCSVRVLLQLP